MNRLELTFAILKPHVIKQPLAVEKIRNIILTSNFKVVKSKRHTIQLHEAESFYHEHKTKFFYKRLVTFMTSGPSDFYILAREDAIKTWRQLMGPTKVFKTQFEAPDSIRGQFGLSDTRNATHGSDSPESVKKEIGLFFPHFDIEQWYKLDEPKFRLNQTEFIKENFVHIIK
ncbi:nucleoside diphosphate kinase 6 [Tribolium castaneum]|uniref:nucleoside diphosphate kinase 6 n=1 Tax=Tribolium castaneum TaxID=7070 RepID=UPI0000D56BCF|nr:PREDICTED: nucleoside diphosphate kinase 6 [Tribolium castaneum]|eukprot:XP_972639.3 PREDICTED: nucleoside diphosphate kinase 6 [Tribolium castaneum]